MLGSPSPFKEYGYPCILQTLRTVPSLAQPLHPSPGTVSGRVQWSPATLATLIFHRLPTLANVGNHGSAEPKKNEFYNDKLKL